MTCEDSTSSTSTTRIRNTEENQLETHQDQDSVSSFWSLFFTTKGTISILVLSILVSFSLGSVVGIVPDVVADRYARLRYDYSGADCASFDRWEKPPECQKGADDAQDAVATATLALNLLTLVFNPVVGSLSDVQGRRGMILMALGLYSIGATAFFVVQCLPQCTPTVYYVAFSLSGAVDFLSMSFAAASDVLPKSMRAPGYGILLAGYYFGFSVAPSIPLVLSHFYTSLFSCLAALLALILAILFLPETLPENVARENRQTRLLQQQQQQQQQLQSSPDNNPPFASIGTNTASSATVLTPNQQDWRKQVSSTILRPVRDMTILTRGNLPILTAAFFFSAMVYSSDKTFVIYYIEDQLNVRDADLAKMFVVFGPVGVVIQAFFFPLLLPIVGEKELLLVAFASGTCHNALYGLAKTKSTILAALCLSQLTKINFPILSSYASKSATSYEQGRVQGALFALNALANAVGPMMLEVVYDATKDGPRPGTMFLCAAGLYAIGGVLVSWLPRMETTMSSGDSEDSSETENSLEEALLPNSSGED